MCTVTVATRRAVRSCVGTRRFGMSSYAAPRCLDESSGKPWEHTALARR